jgi:riboflavin kinase/FMN adenylyltransferase
MVELWAGPDFALGHRREGDVPFLQRMGEQEGFAVRVVPPLQWQGGAVSSTRIRAALAVGEIEEANACLGRPYALTGVVVRGQGLGHQFRVPTANIEPPPGRLIPANGVYACRADTGQAKGCLAVVNVGVRPTVASDGLAVEAYLLDFAGDLYGQQLRLKFIARLRDEVHFPTVNALLAQLQRDIVRARIVLAVYQSSEV